MKFLQFSIFSLILAVLCVSVVAQPPTQIKRGTALDWDSQTNGAFILSLCADKQGGIWVGTEDNGAWRYDPVAHKWQNFTTQNGLGDSDVFALACDKEGRVWAGHLNHGVSVWNGTRWQNYDVLNGPLGERVYDIAICPTDGDIWIATNAGLARYHANREWLYYHRGTGMPAGQCSALSFDDNGRLFAGTHCDGLLIASPQDNYGAWKQIKSPFPKFPYAAVGRDLPSNVINDVLAMKNGQVFVATRAGIARSDDSGQSWMFIRGADWQMKMDGIYDNPQLPVVETKPVRYAGTILREDSVNCLAEDDKGRLWIGYDNKGCQARDPQTNNRLYDSSDDITPDPNGDCVRAILPMSGVAPTAIYGRYGGSIGGLGSAGRIIATNLEARVENIPLPVPAAPPNATILQNMQKFLATYDKTLQPGEGVYLGADWRTQGDWVGRYGLTKGVLCAVQNPSGYFFGNAPGYEIKDGIGPHFKDYDGIYTYVHELYTDNPRVLVYPPKGTRRQAEWNDGTWQGDKYPATFEGPDLWVKLKIPAGLHRVALNFYNKDAHSGVNKYRDFIVQLKKDDANRDIVDAAPPIAQARVRDFWGGVYQLFAVQGPGDFVFKIVRQGSHAVTLQGVFLDSEDAKFAANYQPPTPETATGDAVNLWNTAGMLRDKSEGAAWQYPARLFAYRALIQDNDKPNLQANWRWQIPLWTAEDHATFAQDMARLYPPLKK